MIGKTRRDFAVAALVVSTHGPFACLLGSSLYQLLSICSSPDRAACQTLHSIQPAFPQATVPFTAIGAVQHHLCCDLLVLPALLQFRLT